MELYFVAAYLKNIFANIAHLSSFMHFILYLFTCNDYLIFIFELKIIKKLIKNILKNVLIDL